MGNAIYFKYFLLSYLRLMERHWIIREVYGAQQSGLWSSGLWSSDRKFNCAYESRVLYNKALSKFEMMSKHMDCFWREI